MVASVFSKEVEAKSQRAASPFEIGRTPGSAAVSFFNRFGVVGIVSSMFLDFHVMAPFEVVPFIKIARDGVESAETE